MNAMNTSQQGSPTLVLEIYCPVGFRLISAPTQGIQIIAFPLLHANMFGKGLVTSYLFKSGVLKKRLYLKPKTCQTVDLED